MGLPVRNHGRQPTAGGRGTLTLLPPVLSSHTHGLGVRQGHSRRLGLDRGSMLASDVILTTHSSLSLEREEEKQKEVILQDSCRRSGVFSLGLGKVFFRHFTKVIVMLF